MKDDWKGEHLIRGRKTGIEELRRLTNLLHHKKRRAAGLPPAGKRQHDLVVHRTFKRDKPDA